MLLVAFKSTPICLCDSIELFKYKKSRHCNDLLKKSSYIIKK
jgi:hypothetical protein